MNEPAPMNATHCASASVCVIAVVCMDDAAVEAWGVDDKGTAVVPLPVEPDVPVVDVKYGAHESQHFVGT